MGNSLREELLKAGIVSPRQASKSLAAHRHKPRGKSGKRKSDEARPKGSLSRQQATQPAQEKAVPGDRGEPDIGNKKQKKAFKARLRQLLRRHMLNKTEAEIAHNYVVGRCIRRIYVTEEQHRSLSEGSLAIALFGDRSYLVSLETAQNLRELDPSLTVLVSEREYKPEPDDPYATYRIPDDIMW